MRLSMCSCRAVGTAVLSYGATTATNPPKVRPATGDSHPGEGGRRPRVCGARTWGCLGSTAIDPIGLTERTVVPPDGTFGPEGGQISVQRDVDPASEQDQRRHEPGENHQPAEHIRRKASAHP